MSKFEINGLFCWKNLNGLRRCLPCGLNFYDKLWWRWMPGVIINVRWPTGQVKASSYRAGHPSFEYVDSADPNDHYRPWLTEHVGRQGWDWNWGMADRDATENRLTIKFRQAHSDSAVMAALMWA